MCVYVCTLFLLDSTRDSTGWEDREGAVIAPECVCMYVRMYVCVCMHVWEEKGNVYGYV